MVAFEDGDSGQRGSFVLHQFRDFGVPDVITQFSCGAKAMLKSERGGRLAEAAGGRRRAIAETVVSSTKEGWSPQIGEESDRRMSPQKAADMNPPLQDNIHGWNEHPNYLLGLWRVGDAEPLPAPDDSWSNEAIATAAPSLAAAEALAARAAVSNRLGHDYDIQDGGHQACEAHRSQAAPLEGGGYSYREKASQDMLDLGSDILHHVRYVVLRRRGDLKVGPAELGVAPRTWRFTPANRRLVFEVDVPGRGVTLR